MRTTDRVTAVLVGLLVVLVVGGSATAFVVGRDRREAAGSGTPSMSSAPVTTPSSSAPGTTTTAPPSSTRATSTRPTPAPSSSAPATTTQDDGLVVGISRQAAAHPQAAAIRELVRRHFLAINTRDYQLWVETVTPEQSDRLGALNWAEAYRTTVDTDVVITRIDPQTNWVTMTFRSEQAPEKSPDGKSDCLLWSTTQPAVPYRGGLRLAKSVESMASHRPCTS